jgi:hypothetical protein
MEAVMYDARSCRAVAVDCLSAHPCEPHYRKLNLAMAALWLSLARHDEAMGNLLANWDEAEPVIIGGFAAWFPNPNTDLPTPAERAEHH